MKKYTPYLLLIIGIISGYLSYRYSAASSFLFTLGSSSFFYLPGLLFGLLVGAFIAFSAKDELSVKSIIKFICFTAISGGAYYAAVMVTVLTIDAFHNLLVNFFISGAIGASILLVAFNFLFCRVKTGHFILIVLLGGILGAASTLGNLFGFESFGSVLGDQSNNLLFLILFTIWQGGIAFALGREIKAQ